MSGYLTSRGMICPECRTKGNTAAGAPADAAPEASSPAPEASSSAPVPPSSAPPSAAGALRRLAERGEDVEGEMNALLVRQCITAGISFLKRENPEKALDSFENAAGFDPDSVEAWGWRGAALLRLGREEEASASFARILEIDSPAAAARLKDFLRSLPPGAERETALARTILRRVEARASVKPIESIARPKASPEGLKAWAEKRRADAASSPVISRPATPPVAPAAAVAVPSEAPSFDRSLGDPAVRKLRDELILNMWQGAEMFLKNLKDLDEREYYLEALSDWPDRPAFLDMWLAGRAASVFPLLLRGHHAVRWARAARTQADLPAGEAERLFTERMRAAENDLIRAFTMDPAEPLAYACMIETADALGFGREAAEKRFAEAKRLHPGSRLAHRAMLGLPGTDLLAFARTAAAKAPPGSALHSLIPTGHIEVWRADKKGNYFRDETVKKEIGGTYRVSAGIPNLADTGPNFADRNLFAFCFAHTGETELARKEFLRIGARQTAYPWEILGEPSEVFRRLRETCAQAGGCP